MPDLIERFRAGDPDAVRTVYREHAGAVHTVARSIVSDRELVADIVQQTFVKAWRAAATFPPAPRTPVAVRRQPKRAAPRSTGREVSAQACESGAVYGPGDRCRAAMLSR